MNNRKTSDLRFSISGIDPNNERDCYLVEMFYEMLLRIFENDDADEAVINTFAGKEEVATGVQTSTDPDEQVRTTEQDQQDTRDVQLRRRHTRPPRQRRKQVDPTEQVRFTGRPIPVRVNLPGVGGDVEENKPKPLSRDDFLQIYPRRPKAPVEYIHKDLEIGLYFGPRKRNETIWKKVSECGIAETGKMMSLYQIFGIVGISWVSVFVRPDGDDAKVCEAIDAKGVSCRYFITDLEGQINLDL